MSIDKVKEQAKEGNHKVSSKVLSTILGAKYGYGFIEVPKRETSEAERKAIKRMAKHIRNKGKLNESRIIRVHTLDEDKAIRNLARILKR